MPYSNTQEKFVSSRDATRLHILQTHCDADACISRPHVLVVPGMLSSGIDMAELVHLERHNALYVTLRGRGKSDVAQTNYSFQSHVDDIAAAATAIENNNGIVLIAHSVGAVIALHYAAVSTAVRAVILIDGVTKYGPIPSRWLESVRKHSTIAVQELERIVADSDYSNTVEILGSIRCPVHALVPAKDSLMCRLEHDVLCKEHLPAFTIEAYPNTNHETVCSAPASYDDMIEHLLFVSKNL